MQSSHGKSRRRHVVDADDLQQLPVSRADDQQTGSHSRSNQHSSRSITHKTSISDRYRQTESSVNHHQGKDLRTDDVSRSRNRHDDDDYSHSRRDVHRETYNNNSAQDSRHPEERSNPTSRRTHFTSSNRSWRHSEDIHATSSRTEKDSWKNSSRHDRSRDDRDEWISNEAGHEREKGRYDRDADYSPKDNQGSRRGKERRPDDPERRTRNDPSDERQFHSVKGEGQDADRFWEPAASWKTREKNAHNQNFEGNSGRYSNNKRNGKGYITDKRTHHQQRRDWRDDGDMNK